MMETIWEIKFQGESDSGATRNCAKITGKIGDAVTLKMVFLNLHFSKRVLKI